MGATCRMHNGANQDWSGIPDAAIKQQVEVKGQGPFSVYCFMTLLELPEICQVEVEDQALFSIS